MQRVSHQTIRLVRLTAPRTTLSSPTIALTFLPPSARAFSTSPLVSSKASKSRTGRKYNFGAPSPAPAAAAPGQTTVGNEVPGQAGTDVAHGGRGGGGLFEGGPAAESVDPDQLEKEMLASQGPLKKEVEGKDGERENYAGTDVAQGGVGVASATTPSNAEGKKGSEGEYGPEAVIYTTTHPYNVALMLTVAYVTGVFAFALADFARVGVETYDEEGGEYKVASAWKRYPIAIGAAGAGTALIVGATFAPTRALTKISLRRSATSLATSRYAFPRDSRLVFYHPLSRLHAKFGRKPREVELSKVHLLGPLCDPKPYHPLILEEKKKAGRLETLFSKLGLTSNAASKKRATTKGTHAPFIVEGDRYTYSIALKRAVPHQEGATTGAWCKDWEALERAMLGVNEEKWAKKPY
ncbi:hypothetical protein JCM11251_000716 [Rhodosporidiobolus azoricus]